MFTKGNKLGKLNKGKTTSPRTTFKKGHKMLPGSERGWFKEGHTLGKRYKKGERPSPKTEFKRDRVVGEKNVNWKGGISKGKGYSGFITRRRNLKKLGNGGSHTIGDWDNLKAQYNWTCPACKRSEPEIKLTADHIIPLSKGGSDDIINIQPLCGSCNSKKYVGTNDFTREVLNSI